MRDTIQLRCDKCGHIHHYNSHFIEGVLKGMKKEKYQEVARQMHEKCGPFYDKWKAAMESRGEQKRCKDCVGFEGTALRYTLPNLPCKRLGHQGGEFACPIFIEFDRG